MRLARLHAPFDHQDWIFEPKLDGFHAMAYIQNGAAQLVSRNRNVYTSFPAHTNVLAASVRVQLRPLGGRVLRASAQGQRYSAK
jgi:ATP-dependent DNA ligase